MALRPISTLKAWFLTGLKPLQSQFHDWMDSYWHKDESIPQSVISGLSAALNDKADASLVSSLSPVVLSGSEGSVNHSTSGGNILYKVRIKSTSLMANFKIGTTNGGSEILPDDNVPSGVAGIYTLDFDLENPTTIYFSGLAGTWSIKLIFQ
jgi:hypothetical protein